MKKGSIIPYIVITILIVILIAAGYFGYQTVTKEFTVDDKASEITSIDHTAHEIPVADGKLTNTKVNLVQPEMSAETKTALDTAVANLHKNANVVQTSGTNGYKKEDTIIGATGQEVKNNGSLIIEKREDSDPSIDGPAAASAPREDTPVQQNEVNTSAQNDNNQATGTQSTESGEQNKYDLIPDLNLPFDLYMRDSLPAFYETGEYTEQGVNEFGVQDTSGEAAIANVMNTLFDTTVYTENNVLKKTVESNNCSATGAQNPYQVATVLEGMGQYTEDKVAVDVMTGGNIPSDDELLWLVNNGGKMIIPLGLYQGRDGNVTVQWAAVTGIENGILGNATGFRVVTTNGGKTRTMSPQEFRNTLNNLGAEPVVICALKL